MQNLRKQPFFKYTMASDQRIGGFLPPLVNLDFDFTMKKIQSQYSIGIKFAIKTKYEKIYMANLLYF